MTQLLQQIMNFYLEDLTTASLSQNVSTQAQFIENTYNMNSTRIVIDNML